MNNQRQRRKRVEGGMGGYGGPSEVFFANGEEESPVTFSKTAQGQEHTDGDQALDVRGGEESV